ncbi:MAG: flagellar biosynthesis anti-sigma factor FlgM [Fimbriimonas sp.]|nr:flagellar biosynthesis anti-sigma factor FlgM [Fimbriimonas sp.]
MRISDAEVKRIISGPGQSIVEEIEEVGKDNVRQQDKLMVKALAQEILAMPDRQEMIDELKAQIEAGEYNPSGEEIVDAMIRRAVADKLGHRS